MNELVSASQETVPSRLAEERSCMRRPTCAPRRKRRSEPKSPGRLRVTIGRKAAIGSRQLVLIDVLTSGVPVDTLRAPLLHAWERSMSMCRPGCRAGAHPHITRLDQTKNAHAAN